MTTKKKLGSKLANSVRQVKSQREHEPATVAPAAKQATQPAPVNRAAAKPAESRPLQQQPVPSTGSLHPRRIWPD